MAAPGHRVGLLRIACFVLLSAALARWVQAEPVTTILDSGDAANRVDIVVLGDGYTASELSKFASDAQAVIDGLFAQEPLLEYRPYFNVHRIDVASKDSGVSHPESDPPVLKDTPFATEYHCHGSACYPYANHTKINDFVQGVLPPEKRDTILVLVNEASSSGTGGGGIAIFGVSWATADLALHELGHSFGDLADEYYENSAPCDPSAPEPSAVNVTRETQLSRIKWNLWIDPSTSLPTPGTDPGVPGLYEGAYYCPTGFFRPTYNSKMRVVTQPFEQVNTEQLIKRLYNQVSPIDSSTPDASVLKLPRGLTQPFHVAILSPPTHVLTATWRLDGQTVGAGQDFTLHPNTLTLGDHTVEVEVRDPTPMVRNDPSELLTDHQAWTVTVTSGVTVTVLRAGTGTGTVTSTPAGITCGSDCAETYLGGTPVTLTANASPGSLFTGWSGGCSGQGACQLNLTADTTATATFEKLFKVHVTLEGSGSGRVMISPPGISCGSDCSPDAYGQVTLTALPGPGSRFVRWRGGCTETSMTCQLSPSGGDTQWVGVMFSKVFTDDPLLNRVTTIKALHTAELRTAIDVLRTRYHLAPVIWTDSTLVPGSTPVKRAHLIELRTALTEVYQAAGRALPTYTDPSIVTGTIPIKASHLSELRTFVRSLE